MTCIKELLNNTSLHKVDARVLLGHLIEVHLGWPKSALISKDTDALPENLIQAWQNFEQRRMAGEPVAYILGFKSFYNIDLQVAPGVLIPRPETELLVEIAIAHIQRLKEINKNLQTEKTSNHESDAPNILDLGTGSGAIALALAHNIPNAHVTAVDLNQDALNIAKSNAQLLNLGDRTALLHGSWFDPVKAGSLFDVIVSNPPYIKAGDPHLQEGDLRFEPADALTDHKDGLSPYRSIFNQAKAFLAPQGLLLVEHGYDQSETLQQLLALEGYQDIQVHFDLAGISRALSAKLS
jgi:release factor glutamine methyltransferase